MAAKTGKRGIAARLRALLVREDWIYLSSLLVPLFVYNVALKVIRVLTQFEAPGPLGFLDQVRSDLLFNLGYAALWVGVFAALRGGVGRLIVLILFHVSAMVVLALTTSAHFFFESTGSTLDLGFVIVSISSFGEIEGAIASETTTLHWLLISGVLFYGLAGPVVVTRLFTGTWHVPAGNAGRPWTAPIAACLAALLFFSLSLLPSATGAGNAFSRDAVANMIVSELVTQEIDAKLAAEDLPTHTRLVPTPQTTKRNVVMIFLESTRARSTTPYNKDIDTTPFLDELSKESLMAERAYAVVPHTSKALVATLCGVAPPLDDEKTESEPDVIPARCIADLLKEQGYRTSFFQSATEDFERRRMLVENLGHEDFFPIEVMSKEGFQEANYFGYEDNIMLKPSRTWLEENGDEGPFLATYLTVTPHHDYVVPDRYGKKHFADDEVLNKYLNTVRYQDFFVKNLFEQYKELGLYEDTIFILLGDHGEGFDEHGLKQHDNVIYNEGLHIPFFIHDPRRPESGTIEAPVNELDVLPTVANLLGYEIRGGTYPGSSMLSALEERTLMASCYHERTCLASIRGDEKYIYHYGNKGEEFFDLSEDPLEKNNIIERHDDEEIKALRNHLLAWEAQVRASYEQRLQDEGTTSSE
jgi:phosphoglycerol transferase MdoB-like AlkP superfamily enzyme